MAQYEAGKRTREEIIEAAGELAAERGLDNFTTRQVAERASVNIWQHSLPFWWKRWIAGGTGGGSDTGMG